MPKTKKTKKYKTNEPLNRALFITSVALNIGFVAFLLIVWGLWNSGNINDDQIQSTLCHNFYKNIQTGPDMNDINFTNKSTKIGNITFVDTYVSPALINSPCWLESQATNYALLTQINNSAAISYYNNVTNSHPSSSVTQFRVPLFINSQTKKPTVFPY